MRFRRADEEFGRRYLFLNMHKKTKKRCRNDCAQNPQLLQRRHSNLLLHSKKASNDKLRTRNVSWNSTPKPFSCLRKPTLGEFVFDWGRITSQNSKCPNLRQWIKMWEKRKFGTFHQMLVNFMDWGCNRPDVNLSKVRRIDYVAGDDSTDGNCEKSTSQVVLTIGGLGDAPFVMRDRIKNNNLMAKIDFGSPVSETTTNDWKETVCTDVYCLPDFFQNRKKMWLLTNKLWFFLDLFTCN